jgi:hypothetical protein
MPSLTSWSIMTQPCTRTWCNWLALLVLPGTRAMKTMPGAVEGDQGGLAPSAGDPAEFLLGDLA